MKIVRFLGGLGNQMFQYAFYKSLELQFKNVKADILEFENYTHHNGFELEKIFPLRINHASRFEINFIDFRNRAWKYRKLRRLLFFKGGYYEEWPFFSYEDSIFRDHSSKIYWGYWQHHDYVDKVGDQLRKDFVFPALDPSPNLELLKELGQEEKSVAIHVRRGDYLKDPYLGGLVNLAYFENGISYMKERLAHPRFYVFSDDMAWCKENLPLGNDAIFVDWNIGNESYRDMQLISQCKHAIISNSTFSWWGAWLNQHPEKLVVVPKLWWRHPDIKVDTSQMHPTAWITIEG
ncbi:Glycosyl transferase family 11 [bacterium A37T11]|nr:Glycosyl transferase family 11 [bacterium A37T11]